MSQARPRIPFAAVLVAAIVVMLIPVAAPRSWLPAEKTTRDLVLAGIMIAALAAILGGWMIFGRKRDE